MQTYLVKNKTRKMRIIFDVKILERYQVPKTIYTLKDAIFLHTLSLEMTMIYLLTYSPLYAF